MTNLPMTNQPRIPRLVIATHNAGKLREFAAMLAPFVDEVVSVGQLGLAEPEETGATFTDNALIKARAAAEATHSVALADDSGLCVTALDNAPGIYSARWGGEARDFNAAMQRVHNELGASPDRSAHFACVLALVWSDGRHICFEGRVDGQICWPPRGNSGHGYDPFFVPDSFKQSFAEMDAETKNAISHRGLAVQKFLDYLGQARG